MQPVTGNNSSGVNKCKETSSKCVVWDGPDINCLGISLCKGQSIEVIVYNTAKQLCDLLEMLNVSTIDLACLTPFPGTQLPENIIQVSELIITKLCELNEIIIDLQNTGTTLIQVPLPDCDQIIANCPVNVTTQYTDANGNLVTQLPLIGSDGQTSPAVEYLAELICDLLCRMSTAETEIADLRTDVDNIMNQIAGALPPVIVPGCINGITTEQSIVDPDDATVGALPDMATLLCDIKEELVNGNSVNTLTAYALDPNVAVDCNTTISTATPLGVYPLMSPPPLIMEDLGAIYDPQTLQEVITNLWVAVCDLRNFAAIVKANCCPPYCNSVVWEMAAGTIDLSRDTVRIYLNGTLTDYFGNTTIVASSVPSPGFDPTGPPSFYGGNFPYDITISDQSGNSITITDTPIEDLFTFGNFIDIPNLNSTGTPSFINPLDNYDVTLTAYIVAPDFSVCNQILTKTILSVCDNQPFVSLTNLYVGFDGVTIQYALPGGAWPAGGTIAETIEIEIIDITNGGITVDSGSIDYANYTGNEIYIYSDSVNVLPSGSCSGGCLNFFQTDNIQPNTTYQIKMRILYNCGTSAWTVSPSFTTFVPIEITLKGSAADVCVLGGSLQLIADGALPGDISMNFEDTINFNPAADTVVTVFAKAGTQFGYVLDTPFIVDTLVAIQPCPVQVGTRCWGPPSLYKYQTGGTSLPYFQDMLSQYPIEGCYDYIDCSIVGDLVTLGYTGPTNLNNIDNPGTPANKPGNASQNLDNSPTAVPPYSPLIISAAFDPNSDPVPIQITIDPVLHPMNGGAVPTLTVIITDTDGYLADDSLIYFPAPSISNLAPITQLGVPITLSYNSRTISYGVGTYLTTQGRPTSYLSAFLNDGDLPVGVPAFMKITIQKWNGATYMTPATGIYYITADWLNALLTNISTTGFTMTNTGLQLRDKIKIEWTSGVQNNNNNPDYPLGSGGPGLAQQTIGKVTVTQDPYPGVISPFSACDVKYQPSYNIATAGNLVQGAGCSLWGDTTFYPQAVYNTTTNKSIEFIVTGDTTIEWEVSSTVITC